MPRDLISLSVVQFCLKLKLPSLSFCMAAFGGVIKECHLPFQVNKGHCGHQAVSPTVHPEGTQDGEKQDTSPR